MHIDKRPGLGRELPAHHECHDISGTLGYKIPAQWPTEHVGLHIIPLLILTNVSIKPFARSCGSQCPFIFSCIILSISILCDCVQISETRLLEASAHFPPLLRDHRPASESSWKPQERSSLVQALTQWYLRE